MRFVCAALGRDGVAWGPSCGRLETRFGGRYKPEGGGGGVAGGGRRRLVGLTVTLERGIAMKAQYTVGGGGGGALTPAPSSFRCKRGAGVWCWGMCHCCIPIAHTRPFGFLDFRKNRCFRIFRVSCISGNIAKSSEKFRKILKKFKSHNFQESRRWPSLVPLHDMVVPIAHNMRAPPPPFTQEYIEDGMSDFCPKPIKKDSLVRVLFTVTGDKRRQGSPRAAPVSQKPLAKAVPPVSTSGSGSLFLELSELRALIVEPNVLTRMLLRRFLDKLHWKSDECGMPQEALSFLQKKKYQVRRPCHCCIPVAHTALLIC